MKTKKSLLLSVLALLLCISMLVGSTFAWFTDGVTSGVNIIQAGNLSAGLYWSEDMVNWYDARDTVNIFGGEEWEPGFSQIRYFKVVNDGSLAFRYKLSLVPGDTLGVLAQTIDVYWSQAPQVPYDSFSQMQTEAERIGTVQSLVGGTLCRNAVLPADQQSEDYSSGSHVFVLALRMQDDVPNTYQGMALGTFTLMLEATQLGYENDSFGSDYDAAEEITLEKQLVPGVTDVLPQSAIAGSAGVNFTTAPYAYTDTSLFAGKRITKIGIPVKTVKALDENQTFTLSVVKTNVDAYTYTAQYVLNLPLDQLGSSTAVNDWVYVDLTDLNVVLGEDETLAFGMPTDTVEWGYLSTSNKLYTFRSATGNWQQRITRSILFDVYTEEVLSFEQTANGLAAVYEAPVLESVKQVFPAGGISGGNDVSFASPPYAYTVNKDIFAGKKITKIGIPVKTVKALDENQTFTLSVVKTTSDTYQYVSQYTLALPLAQLGTGTTVNRWVYVDVSDLNIVLGEDETLAFGGKDDTVTWAWKSGYADSNYYFRNVSQTWSNRSGGIFFDVYTEEMLTYEDYQKQLQEEQERIEAEQEQLRADQALQAVIGGKKISILGDSISTFQGYSNNTSYNSTIGSNAIYYNGSRDGFTAVHETWWMQTIDRSGLQLLVNNSWSGDTVTGRGVGRALELDNNEDVPPDVIAVYLGINDFRTKVTAQTFAAKYEEMIKGMTEKYPDADVFLFTLVYTTNVYSGVNPDDVVNFNDAIKAVAEKYGCALVDLYNDSGINKDTMAANMGDGNLHPNYAGMDKITQCFMDVLMEQYVK